VTTVDELHTVFKEHYKPSPKCIHVTSLPCFNKYLEPHLDKIEGHTKPAVFIVKRGPDGIVRHHYKQDMQTRKSEYPTCILPRNRLGLRLFEKHGFPSMSETVIPCVPWRSVRLKELTRTASYLSNKRWILPKTNSWWSKMLQTQEDDEFNRCPECKVIRDKLHLTRQNHADPILVRRKKGRERYKYEKELGKHLLDFSTGFHKAFPLKFPNGSDFMAPLPPAPPVESQVVANLGASDSDSDPQPTDSDPSFSDSQPRVNLSEMQQCLLSESEVDNDDILQFPPPAIEPDLGPSDSGQRGKTSRHFSPPDPDLSFVESGSASEPHFSGSRNMLQRDGLSPMKVNDLVMVIPPIDGSVEGLLNSSGWEYWLKRPFWLGKVLSIDPSSSEAKFKYQLYGIPKLLWKGKYLPGWIDKSKCSKDNQIPQETYDKTSRNRPALSMHSDGDSVYFWFQSLTTQHKISKRVWNVINKDPRFIARCNELGCSTEFV
jgi:hypothetical protein